MLKNYLKTALRNLWREKGSTLLNLLGLTLGIASSLILFLLIRYHFSFDTYHANRDSIYRVGSESNGNNGKDYSSGIPSVLPEAFRIDFPEAEEVTFTSYRSGSLITIPQPVGEPKKFEEERGVTFAQPNFFKIFDRKVIAGTVENGLDEPNEAIITRSWAAKYFGKEDALGEVLRFDKREYKITAIVEDPPSNTDLPFSLFLSYATVKKELEDHGWNSTWSDEHCYIKLGKGASVEEIERRMPDFVKKYLGADNRDDRTFVMQPLAEIHFDDRFGNYSYSTVSRPVLLSLSLVAVFLILTACINFINLSTAEAIKRSKEVGIRKSLGSTRKQLMLQFLGETSLVAVTATLLAIAVVLLSLEFLNTFLKLQLTLSLTDTTLWLYVASVTILVSLLSGLYPSFVVSSFSPVSALKNKLSNRNTSGFALRRVLVVFQFIISQFLVIATIVLITQMNYFRNKELGFRKDAILTVPIPVQEEPGSGDSARSCRMRTLRNEIMRLGGVELASLNNHPPSSGNTSNTGFTMEGNQTFYETQVKAVDSNYLDLFGLQIVAGQNIVDLDTAQGILVNEKLAAMVGYKNPQEIIGKTMNMWRKKLPVVGVIKDFHTVSLHTPIEATVMLNRIRNYRSLSVRITPVNMQETVKEIQQKWEAAYSDFIFSYEFLDESIREFYESERRTSILLSIFTSLAIFIGCLGLFGLASFIANQKTKEIGVRKVLGASVENILFIFSKEFIVLIFIGFACTVPLAWYAMNLWLNGFAYKIAMGPGVFLAGLGVTLAIAMITVGYRSVRAATINPVESLKSE